MSDLKNILKRVQSGERHFRAEDHNLDSLRRFQPIAKALVHAKNEGLLEDCKFSKESLCGDLYYDVVYVIGGLSFKGEEYLQREATLKGWALKRSPHALKWLFGILAGLILAILASWLK